MQLITKVNQIMHDVDNTIQVTHAYRIGQTNNKSKLRPIIACLETEKQKYAAKLTDSNAQQNFKTPLLVKISVMISKSLDRNSSENIKQQYRSVCFRGTELI